MAKIPYLFRRKNIYYFRIRIPAEHQKTLKAREITQSLGTENRADAIPLAPKLADHARMTFRQLKAGQIQAINSSDLLRSSLANEHSINSWAPSSTICSSTPNPSRAPLLSLVISDFLKQYDSNNKATLTKLNSSLPILLELIGDKPINQIPQADINSFFEEVQKLSVKRSKKEFKGMTGNARLQFFIYSSI